jgi:type 1 glutamine amidotransferase
MNRRDLLKSGGAAALALSHFPFGWNARAAERAARRRLLVYTRSQTFEHSVVRPAKGKTVSLVDQTLTDMGKAHGFDVTCTKDGRVFLPDTLKGYDAVFFETTGDLTKEGGDKQPPMLPEGKKALLDFVASGKGFVGSHCASDTFHSGGMQWQNQEPDKLDPYIKMLGGEFIRHGEQQEAWMRVTDPHFPGVKDLKDFNIKEEWYSLKNFAPDIHVILVQDTKGMRNLDYERPNYPATWARMHDKGRVFYTSMGHREDVWESKTFQQLLLGGLQWAFGDVQADIPPNLKETAPKAGDLPNPKK